MLYHPGFTAVNLKAKSVRRHADNFGGESHTRFLGAPIVHTSVHVFRVMLEEVVSDDPAVYEDGWDPDDYGREDLVMKSTNKQE